MVSGAVAGFIVFAGIAIFIWIMSEHDKNKVRHHSSNMENSDYSKRYRELEAEGDYKSHKAEQRYHESGQAYRDSRKKFHNFFGVSDRRIKK